MTYGEIHQAFVDNLCRVEQDANGRVGFYAEDHLVVFTYPTSKYPCISSCNHYKQLDYDDITPKDIADRVSYVRKLYKLEMVRERLEDINKDFNE